MPAERRPARPARPATVPAVPAVLAVLAVLATLSTLTLGLAGCASTASESPSATATSATAEPTATSLPAVTPAPQPTPLPVGTFTTYTNTTYSYSISYPHNWSVEGATAASQSFIIFNYDPQTYQQPTSAPPLLKIEIDAVPNPNGLSALDLFKQTASGPGSPPATIISAQEATLANHPSTQIVWSSPPGQYPTITYISIAPHSTTALFISQSNAAGGQPAPVFTQMLASLTISG